MLKKLRQSPAFNLALWAVLLGIVFFPWLIAAKPVAVGVLTFLLLVGVKTLYVLPASIWFKLKKGPQDLLENKVILEISVRKLAFFLAGLFFISGFVKLQDITGFSYKLDEYWEVFGTQFMKPLSLFTAWFVSVLEIALGFALIAGYRMKITTLLTAGMMVFFTFLTGYSAITGAVTDCGCFGDALKLTPYESFFKDIILTLAVLPLWLLRAEIKPLYQKFLPAGLTFGSFILFGFISWYTWQHLPPLDFRTAYKVCQDLQYNSKNFNEHDEIIAHDFVPFGYDCEMKEFEGNSLYIISYDLENASESGMKAAVDLANELNGSDIKVFGGTGTGSDDRPKFVEKYNIPFCLSPQDVTMLKTMVRSNPGFMLLKDGVIKGKWHHNDIPSVEELRETLKSKCD